MREYVTVTPGPYNKFGNVSYNARVIATARKPTPHITSQLMDRDGWLLWPTVLVTRSYSHVELG